MLTKEQALVLLAYEDFWAEREVLYTTPSKVISRKRQEKWRRREERNNWITQKFYKNKTRAAHTTLTFSPREMLPSLEKDFSQNIYLIGQIRQHGYRRKRIPTIGHPIIVYTEIVSIPPPQQSWEDILRCRAIFKQRLENKFSRDITL